MTAEIVAVGTELLLGQIVDTHSATMSRILAECGIGCMRRQTVGDNFDRIVTSFRQALDRSDILIAIGGLGPTEDDLTRDAIAAALDEHLVEVPDVAESLRRYFEMRGFPFTESNLRQAQKPASAELIENPHGTAPGLLIRKNEKIVVALPGPKGEFEPMANGPVKKFLSEHAGGEVIFSRTLRVCGKGESYVEDLIRPLLSSGNPTVAPYAKAMEVHLRVTAKAASKEIAEQMIDPVDSKIREILGEAVYGVDDTSLERAVIDMLGKRSETVSVAESITGGGLGERLTNVAGASAGFIGGVITYTAEVKETLLGVSHGTLEREGPISAETARQMAVNIREKLGSTYGIGLTGNAGPTSDKDDPHAKPVGLVYIGVAHQDGCEVTEHRFRGVREDIRLRCTQAALVNLRSLILSRDF